jgi:hypothetical protein
LASGLDQPRVIGANGNDVCFRVGHPNYESAIWCVSTSTLWTVGTGFPRALTFGGDTLYWAEDAEGAVVAATLGATGQAPQPVLDLGSPSSHSYTLGLQAAGSDLLWNDASEDTQTDRLMLARADHTIVHVATLAGSIGAFAPTSQFVYALDVTNNRIMRAPRP